MNRHDANYAKRRFFEPSPEADQAARAVIGCAIEVHQILGPGFLETVYEEALAVELSLRGIHFRRQVTLAIDYKGVPVGEQRADLVVAEKLIVELKAVSDLLAIHTAQVISYLKATNLELGLLINFNVPVLRQGLKRVVHSADPWRALRLGGSTF